MQVTPHGSDRAGSDRPERSRQPPVGRPGIGALSSPAGAAADLIQHLQRAAGNRAVSDLLRAARAPAIQRQDVAAGATPAPAGGEAELIVEDSAPALGQGQLRKTPFLAQLEAAVGGTISESAGPVEGELARAEIAANLEEYRAKDSRTLERSIRAELPEAGQVTSAEAYVPMVAGRVRRELREDGGSPAAAAGPLKRAASAVVDVVQAGAGVVTGLVGALFKRRTAGSPAPRSGVAVALGPGSPLEGSVRSGL
jgi:hypothetical protein